MRSVARTSTAKRRRQLPAWLVVLALTVHLLAPGLCLSQIVSMAPGAVCTAAGADARGAETPLPSPRPERHALEACDHCVASSPALAHGTAPAVAQLPRTAAPPIAAPAPADVASDMAWRPPPRGPPHST
jgi:hypothetical protein